MISLLEIFYVYTFYDGSQHKNFCNSIMVAGAWEHIRKNDAEHRKIEIFLGSSKTPTYKSF